MSLAQAARPTTTSKPAFLASPCLQKPAERGSRTTNCWSKQAHCQELSGSGGLRAHSRGWLGGKGRTADPKDGECEVRNDSKSNTCLSEKDLICLSGTLDRALSQGRASVPTCPIALVHVSSTFYLLSPHIKGLKIPLELETEGSSGVVQGARPPHASLWLCSQGQRGHFIPKGRSLRLDTAPEGQLREIHNRRLYAERWRIIRSRRPHFPSVSSSAH